MIFKSIFLISVFTSFIGIIFSYLSKGTMVFHKYELYTNEFSKYRNGVTIKMVKKALKNTTNKEIVYDLKRCLKFLKLSRVFYLLLFFLFIIWVFVSR